MTWDSRARVPQRHRRWNWTTATCPPDTIAACVHPDTWRCASVAVRRGSTYWIASRVSDASEALAECSGYSGAGPWSGESDSRPVCYVVEPWRRTGHGHNVGQEDRTPPEEQYQPRCHQIGNVSRLQCRLPIDEALRGWRLVSRLHAGETQGLC